MVASFGLMGAAQGCRAPTEAILDVSFNGPCTGGSSIGIIVGTDPKDAERRIQGGIFTTTAECVTGRVGTLVVTPNESTGRAAIVILAGVGKSGRLCLGSDGYKDCIVARRTFTFVEHTSLSIPILLDLDCKDVPCDAESTCDKKQCTKSEINCSGEGCGKPGELPDGGTELVDAPTNPDAYVNTDGAIGVDGNPPEDSGTDSPVVTDSGSCENAHDPVLCNRTVGGPVVCPSNAHACCYGFSPADGGGGVDGGLIDAMSGASGYDCRTGGCNDQPSNPTVRCRGSKNCAAGQVCCRSTMYGGASCMIAPCPNVAPGGPDGGGSGAQQFCENDCECLGGKTCTGQTSFGSATMQTLQVCQ